MILEVAVLDVISGKESAFEGAFKQASSIISEMHGYVSHQIRRCLSVPIGTSYWSNGRRLKTIQLGSAVRPSIRDGRSCSIIFMTRFQQLSTIKVDSSL